ncbi:MAG: hypothetical protein NWR72_19480 [Bacteroidia bacterium]|nr:hypothetical protein [Bacteroidia bacterium]
MARIILFVVLVLFLVLTGFAVADHGYSGIFTLQLENFAGMQVLADLVIALGFFLVWLWQDAKKCGDLYRLPSCLISESWYRLPWRVA